MTRIVGIENEYLTLVCLPELGLIQHTMHRFVVSSALRAGLEKGLALLREHGATKWLSDDRANGALSAEDAAWLATDWEPRAVAAGWQYWAMILPEAVFGRMTIQRRLAAARNAGLVAATFDDVGAALEWLKSQPGGRGRGGG
jgi:hypothetical protein